MNKTIIKAIAAPLLMLAFTSCLDEAMPTEGAIQDEVSNTSSEALVNAVTKYMNTVVNSNQYSDIGYPSLMIRRDVMTADMPVRDPGYYYYSNYAYNLYIGDYQTSTDQWGFYNKLVYLSNLVLRAADATDPSEGGNIATALCYRAMALMDMTRMYEFRPTGTSLDGQLASIAGLTVPISNENTTEKKAFNNPRAPFHKMYRYIMSDLNRAEALITEAGDTGAKNKASRSLVYGLKARLWLEIATRFRLNPDDLALQIENDNISYDSEEDLGEGYALDPLGIKTAAEAYTQAANYALLARQGHTPLTKAEWFSPTSGFNSAEMSSWIWAITMGSSDDMATYYTWQSWISFMAPEAGWGVSSTTYKASHMIDRALYDKIGAKDWRRYTWIDPTDFAEGEPAFKRNYADKTIFNYTQWSSNAPYVGIKFHPGQGNGTTSQTGNCVDIPLMRVEEMYFIQAEAEAFAAGNAAAGIPTLTELMDLRTDGNYTCSASSLDAFIDELLLQKRIEFWGEGLVVFDMKRLGKAIVRGYVGTNHPEEYRMNSLPGYVAPWTNLYIPRRENNINTGCQLNPDPGTVTNQLKWSN